jgi:hypothetical protein
MEKKRIADYQVKSEINVSPHPWTLHLPCSALFPQNSFFGFKETPLKSAQSPHICQLPLQRCGIAAAARIPPGPHRPICSQRRKGP